MQRPFSGAESDALIVRGRACGRMTKAAEVLLAAATSPHERFTHGEARNLARRSLRDWVREVESAISAQILIASEGALGAAGQAAPN